MDINVEALSSQKNITFITKQYRQIYFTSPRHYHNEYEIALIEESNGKLFVGNNIVDFTAGDIFVFAPHLVHCFKNNKSYKQNGKPAKATIILFKKEFLGEDFLLRRETVKLNQLLTYAEQGVQLVNPDSTVVSLIKQLPHKEGLKSIIDFLSILDYCSKCNDYKLLSVAWFKKYYYNLKDERLYKILDYVEKNFATELPFKNIALMANMSEQAFSRYFKQKTEKTFTQYLGEVRITNAQKMLIETNCKINDICHQCGFNNLPYFNRLFKKVNDDTPVHFRKTYVISNRTN